MVIENTKTALRTWKTTLISTIVLVMVIILFYVGHIFVKPVLGISRLHVVILLAIIYLYLILKPVVLKYQFLYFTLTPGKISVNYYTMGILPGTKKAFEFPLNEFYKFETGKSFFKLRENLILFRKMKKGIAKYPPLSLTALKPDSKKKLLKALQTLRTEEK